MIKIKELLIVLAVSLAIPIGIIAVFLVIVFLACLLTF